MPHLTGVFEQFPDLDKVPADNLLSWLPTKVDKHLLINILGNRILYPQTIALSKSELEIDLAILREAVKQKPALVYEAQTNKLLIPELFVRRFPPLARLAGVIIEAISPKGIIQIYLNDKKPKLIGTLISPMDIDKLAGVQKKVKIIVDDVEGTLNPYTLSISHTKEPQVKIKIGNQDYTVSGGDLGVIIDLRVNN